MTPEQKTQLRQEYLLDDASVRAIAEKHGLTVSVVARALRGD